jgi:hypothetical protein
MSIDRAPLVQENPPAPGFLAPDPKNYAASEGIAQRALKLVQEAMSSARDARGQLTSSWQRNVNAFFNIRHRKKVRGRANVVDPEPFRVVETIYARGAKAILGNKPWLRGFPGPGEVMADQEQAELNEALLQQQLEVGSEGSRTIKSNFKSWLILGTAVTKVHWDIETRRRRMRNPLTGRLAKMTDAFVYQGPRWRNVDIEDFYVANPVDGETPDEQDFVIERKTVNLRDLRALDRGGIITNVSKIKPDDLTTSASPDEEMKVSRAHLLGVDYEATQPRSGPVGKADIWMYEGAFDLYDNDEEVECWIWVANGKHVLRVQENPYWHGRRSYVSAPCIRVPGNFYGLSPIQPILDLWAELNDLHNMGLDAAVLSLNPGLIVGATAGLDLNNWLLSPGVAFSPITQIAHQAMAPLRQMMRETTSATDLLQAQGTGGIDKATIYQGAIQEANVRIAMMTGEFAGMMEDGGQKSWALNQQFMRREQLVRVLGRGGYSWRPVRPQDVRYPMDWKAIGVQNIGAELTRNMGLERFVSTFTPLALQGGLPLDFVEIAKTYWSSLGMSDADKIIAPQGPQPMDPQQENLMLRQRQPVDVHPQEDFPIHLRHHLQERQRMQAEPVADEIALGLLDEHVKETQAMFRRVEAAKQAMAQMQAQAMQNQVAAGAPEQGGNGGAPPLGNQVALGPQMGAAKEIGERLGGRPG